MKKIFGETIALMKQKKFVLPIILTAIFTYGALIVHPTVGIDDTSFDIYYEQGVSPAMGRWSLYVINKIFRLTEYNPYFVELAGVSMFCLSVLLWCVLFRKVWGTLLPEVVYVISSCVFLSSPILSEVLVWYLQDGIYLGYGVTALAVLLFLQAIEKNGKERWKYAAWSVVFLTVALGFYEAFMFVFLIAVLLVFMTQRVLAGKKEKQVRSWLAIGMAVCVGSIILRSIVVNGLIWLDGLQEQATVLKSRGIHEVLIWFTGEKSLADLLFIWKQFFALYYINGAVYFSITVFVIAVGILLCFAIGQSIKKRDIWVILAGLAVVLLPWLLPVLEGAVTPYRSSEYIPLVCAFAVLLAAYMCRKWNKKTWVRMAGWMAAVVLLYNQAFEMNRWFHVDNMKYQDAIRFTDELALELEKNYDVTKPILVKGHHRVPYGITQEGYIPYWSKKYIVVSTFLNILDPDLLELYNTEYGYAYVQTPFLSIIDWGTVAFHHNDKELMKFMAMHGHDFTYAGNWEWYLEAEKAVKAMPAWPREGSIVDTGDYILVNLGE